MEVNFVNLVNYIDCITLYSLSDHRYQAFLFVVMQISIERYILRLSIEISIKFKLLLVLLINGCKDNITCS